MELINESSMKTDIFIHTFLVFLLTLYGCTGREDAGAALEEAFRNPPEETRPWVYWYWLNDNISKEGITADLEAMKAAGIGEALIGNVKDPSSSYGTVEALSDEWWDCLEFAVISVVSCIS